MLLKFWRDKSRQEDGLSLVELLVAMSIIVIIMTSTALVMTRTLGFQQETESTDKAVQVSRDYVERTKQANYNTLGFHTADPGFRAKGPNGENTVVIPDNKTTSGLVPLEKKVVGGIEYTIRIDITTTDPAYNFAPKRVTVEVTWAQDNAKPGSTKISVVRAPNASEQIPPALDITVIPGNDGTPSAPTYFDDVNRYAGTASDVLGRKFTVKVLAAGNYPVTDVKFDIECAGQPTYSASYLNPPPGWTTSVSGQTYTMSYYSRPSGLRCDIEEAVTTVNAVNNAGNSGPLTITPVNFLVY